MTMHFNKVSQTNCSKTYNKEAAVLKDVISRNTIKFYKKAYFQVCNNSNAEVKHMTQQPGDYNFCLKLHIQTVGAITALEPAKGHLTQLSGHVCFINFFSTS